MNEKLRKITEKKNALDALRPLPQAILNNLEEWFTVELTYTSNAIEGNTLTRQQTALVVEKGLAVEGKTLREHLEAQSHAETFRFTEALAKKKKRQDLTERDILKIHRSILQKIDLIHAGRYRDVPVRIAGSTAIMPNPMKVPQHMRDFVAWFVRDKETHPATIAADAHFKLVSIHPFVDGNGRSARLLMNLLLMQADYPPAIIRKEDREKYINSLEKGQTRGNLNDYYNIIYDAVDRSLDIYLETAKGEDFYGDYLTMGEIAKATEMTRQVLYKYRNLGLIEPEIRSGKFDLYSKTTIQKVKKIKELKKDYHLEALKPSRSSKPRELPPQLLTEPYLTVSRHTALVIQSQV
jgi:Fic family protein